MPLEKNVELCYCAVLGGPASQPAAHSGVWPTARECAARSPAPRPQPGPGPEIRPGCGHPLGLIWPKAACVAQGRRIKSDGPPSIPAGQNRRRRSAAPNPKPFLLSLAFCAPSGGGRRGAAPPRPSPSFAGALPGLADAPWLCHGCAQTWALLVFSLLSFLSPERRRRPERRSVLCSMEEVAGADGGAAWRCAAAPSCSIFLSSSFFFLHRAAVAIGGRRRGMVTAPPQAHSPACAFSLARARRRRAALLRCPSPHAERRLRSSSRATAVVHRQNGGSGVFPVRRRPTVVRAGTSRRLFSLFYSPSNRLELGLHFCFSICIENLSFLLISFDS